MSNFSFWQSVFKTPALQTVNPFPNKPWFLCVCSASLLKTLWEKDKLLVTSNLSFSPRCFLPVWRTFCHFHQIWNCSLRTLSLWKSSELVVWERVKQVAILSGKICIFCLRDTVCICGQIFLKLAQFFYIIKRLNHIDFEKSNNQ